MTFKRKIISVFMAFALIAVMFVPVYADELSDQQQRLDAINQQIDQQQSNLNNTQKVEKSVIGQITGIEKEASKIQGEINTLANRTLYLQNSITATQKQIVVQQNELDKQSKQLGDRLVKIYEQGDSSYLEVLLAANDFKDFLTRYDMLSRIIQQDKDTIDSINSLKRDLDVKKSDLEVQKRELQSAKTEQEGKKQLLDAQWYQKKVVLTDVEQQKDKLAQALEELEEASRQVESLIIRMQNKGQGARTGTGQFVWPAPGYSSITSPYGMRYHPILKTRKLHTGEDIGAPSGATIVAADSGTVIFSGWMGAYGQAIIIDHGNGVSTLYGHQSQLLVSEGQSVVKGQTIGKVGSTGWSTGPHLHFEVRVNGSPVDPTGYV